MSAGTLAGDARISGSLLRLRARSPFFATLSLFARFLPSERTPTAATDGRDVFYNPVWLSTLPPRQLDGVLVHEVLHAALLHASRRATREPVRWNVAADVVVNGIVAGEPDLELPPGAIREPSLEDRPVEEIYELLEATSLALTLTHGCGLESDDVAPGALERLRSLEAHWRNALRQAEAVARMTAGRLPAGLERVVSAATRPRLDWRAILWRFLAVTPVDFVGFDRRHLARGLYLETLAGESCDVRIAVDTSASIDDRQLAMFLAEVSAIVRSYPHLAATLAYADAELHGPWPLGEDDVPCRPVGGGGTSFVPFFAAVERESLDPHRALCVYLTDGHGHFPARPPDIPVLWVVPPGGRLPQQFPFGEVITLSGEPLTHA